MRLDLLRVGQSKRGTFGVIRHDQVPFVLTLERPWEDNETDISCIPAGRYTCRRVRSMRFGNTYEVCDVPGRTNVLFHKGNFIYDTKGCILIGEEFSGTWDHPFIASSERGFLEFTKLLADISEFDLVIHDPPDIRDESTEV
ncbi:MAG: hypothetical protein IPK83_20385 [Planctomycetes bacterium]|nr:hypothetical protein [Planctomycetota bacterium]